MTSTNRDGTSGGLIDTTGLGYYNEEQFAFPPELPLAPRKIASRGALQLTESSGWKCELFGMGESGFTVYPAVGDVPNAFNRLMQRFFFGNKWSKEEKRP